LQSLHRGSPNKSRPTYRKRNSTSARRTESGTPAQLPKLNNISDFLRSSRADLKLGEGSRSPPVRPRLTLSPRAAGKNNHQGQRPPQLGSFRSAGSQFPEFQAKRAIFSKFSAKKKKKKTTKKKKKDQKREKEKSKPTSRSRFEKLGRVVPADTMSPRQAHLHQHPLDLFLVEKKGARLRPPSSTENVSLGVDETQDAFWVFAARPFPGPSKGGPSTGGTPVIMETGFTLKRPLGLGDDR